MLTQAELQRVLHYNPESGRFVWRVSRGGRAHEGSDAGIVSHGKYLVIRVCGRPYMAHRLAWLYVFGQWPTNQIDHINGDKLDNRIENLRDVSQSVNMQNATNPKRNSTTGFRGVFKARRRYVALIRRGGVTHRLGLFDTPQEASAAYLAAKDVIHAEGMSRLSGLQRQGERPVVWHMEGER